MIQNPAATMATDLEIEHVLDVVAESVIGTDAWSATIIDGIGITAGQKFTASDRFWDGTTFDISHADDLVVKASGATGPYEIDQGRYTLGALLSKINQWLAQALDDGTLRGAFDFVLNHNAGVTRTRLKATPGGTADQCAFTFSMPHQVFRACGEFSEATGSVQGGSFSFTRNGLTAGETIRILSVNPALRNIAELITLTGQLVQLTDERGIFHDQNTSMPFPYLTALGTPPYDGEVGFALLNGNRLMMIMKDGAELRRAVEINVATGQMVQPISMDIPMDHPGASTLTQAFIFVDTLASHLKKMFYSTGVAGYNHSEYDVYPAAMSIGIPGELLGDAFEASCDALSSSDMVLPLIVTKPKKLVDVIGGDLKLRFAFLRFKDGHGDGSPLPWEDPRLDTEQRKIVEAVRKCWAATPRPMPLRFVNTDGGRKAAGFEPWGDCVIRATAVGLGISYTEAFRELLAVHREILGPNGAAGFTGEISGRVLSRRGWRHTQAWKTSGHLHLEDLPKRGRLIVQTIGHEFAVIDGAIHDELRGTMGTPPTCVFGYWEAPPTAQVSDADLERAWGVPRARDILDEVLAL
jgi:hypothetical protein